MAYFDLWTSICERLFGVRSVTKKEILQERQFKRDIEWMEAQTEQLREWQPYFEGVLKSTEKIKNAATDKELDEALDDALHYAYNGKIVKFEDKEGQIHEIDGSDFDAFDEAMNHDDWTMIFE